MALDGTALTLCPGVVENQMLEYKEWVSHLEVLAEWELHTSDVQSNPRSGQPKCDSLTYEIISKLYKNVTIVQYTPSLL